MPSSNPSLGNFPSGFDPGFNIPMQGGFYPDRGITVDDYYEPELEAKPEKSFLDNFKSALEKSGSYLGKTQQDSRRYDIYGDRRRSGGDTVADLGGGNTLSAPDSALAAQLQMQALQNQGQQGGVGRMAGSILGNAAGTAAATSLGAGAGTFLGSALGPIGALAGGALGGLLPF
tara:strand:- start:240 stop:761 length:522 start_codon:yes stop_codon:yes gene_type:complete